jgi:hypothetical protein
VHKNKHWENTIENRRDMIAKLPVVAAASHNWHREGPIDWSQNFAEMIGHKDPMFTEQMRPLPGAHPGPHGNQETLTDM